MGGGRMAKFSRTLASGRSARWAFMDTFIIPNLDKPSETYLTRLRIIQTPLFGIYLHRMDGPDSRPTLHCHPWNFRSFVLRGGYIERRLDPHTLKVNDHHTIRRYNRVRAFESHSIRTLLRVPTWTLVFVGRRVRTWGYWEPEGLVVTNTPKGPQLQDGVAWKWTEFDKHFHQQEFDAAMEDRNGR